MCGLSLIILCLNHWVLQQLAFGLMQYQQIYQYSQYGLLMGIILIFTRDGTS